MKLLKKYSNIKNCEYLSARHYCELDNSDLDILELYISNVNDDDKKLVRIFAEVLNQNAENHREIMELRNQLENESDSESECESDDESDNESECESVREVLKVGDRVVAKKHGNIGTISKVHKSCPQSNDWLALQSIPVKAEDVRDIWYSIHCEPSGMVVCPMSDIVKIAKK